MTRDYSKCDVCGVPLGPDRLHIMIHTGNGLIRHTYACRRHRYVKVKPFGLPEQVQERTDHEIESLASAFRTGELEEAWE